jgi:hypothetical protein
MIFDNFLVLAGAMSAQSAMTGQAFNGAGSILGINTFDLGPPMLNGIPGQIGDIGAGEQIEVSLTVLSTPTVGTSVQFQLIQADDAALSVNVQVINQTDAFPIASLPAGTLVPLHVDRVAPYAPKRYLGLRVVNVGAIATFSVFAAVVKSLQDQRTVFKSGYGIV